MIWRWETLEDESLPAASPVAAAPAALAVADGLPSPLQSAAGVAADVPPPAVSATPAVAAAVHWLAGLEQDARAMLQAGQPEVWDALTRKFEAQLIHTALEITRGRRIEAAQKLGIGRNTITRKIQELGLDD